jgi:methylmalonyl-CoA mutase N-terminal domain/subunit
MFKKEEIKKIEKERLKWAKKIEDDKQLKKEFTTPSGIKIKNIYTPEDIKDVDYIKDIGFPGAYPHVRGVYPTMYRGQHWTIRMFSGFGTPEETNKRWRLLYEEGETGFSAACDVLTFNGIDPDDPEVDAQGEVGTSGTH